MSPFLQLSLFHVFGRSVFICRSYSTLLLLAFIFCFLRTILWCCFLSYFFFLNHLTHCSWASSAKIPFQRLPFFQNSLYSNFPIVCHYFFLLFHFSCFSFVHLVSSAVLHWLLHSPTLYLIPFRILYTSPGLSIFFSLASIICSILMRPRSVHLSPNLFRVIHLHFQL